MSRGADKKNVLEEASTGADVLLNAVIANLSAGPDDVKVIKVAVDHGNSRLEREYKHGVQAYAKVAGMNWTYYVKTLKINIGRPPDPLHTAAAEIPTQSSPVAEESSSMIHIDLGPNKLVSRHHATIEYSSEGVAGWQITVNGRNGVKINDQLLRRGSTKGLQSGDVLEIGGTQMMFVTPNDGPHIHPMFLEKARLLQLGDDEEASAPVERRPQSELMAIPSSASTPHGTNAMALVSSSSVAGLPSVEDQKRESTPPSSKGADQESKSKQSPTYNRGLMLESTEEIDYSQESAKDLKPPYSYATMIGQAILASEEEKLTLSAIYQWIMDKYAFYRRSQSGWQVSITPCCSA